MEALGLIAVAFFFFAYGKKKGRQELEEEIKRKEKYRNM